MTTDVEERQQADDFANELSADLIQLGPPDKKRKPREKRDPNDTTPRRTRRTSATKIKNEIKGALVLGNTAFVQLGGDTGRTYGLVEEEINALTDALYGEIEAHPEWGVWFERVGKLSPHLTLAGVLFSIAMPRIAHAMGNTEGVPDAGNGNDNANRYSEPDATVSMETGRAYGDNRGYGDGEIDASGPSTNGTEGVHRPTFQT
jgi:hypothetical protein